MKINFFLFIYSITLPNANSNLIDFNYFSIAQKALHISDMKGSILNYRGKQYYRPYSYI